MYWYSKTLVFSIGKMAFQYWDFLELSTMNIVLRIRKNMILAKKNNVSVTIDGTNEFDVHSLCFACKQNGTKVPYSHCLINTYMNQNGIQTYFLSSPMVSLFLFRLSIY